MSRSRFTEAQRKKMSESLKLWASTHQHLERGRHLTEEGRKKISEANRGRTLSDETRRKISKSIKGTKRSEESRRNLRLAIRGRVGSWKGKHLSEEHRRHLSESIKRTWSDPIYRDRNVRAVIKGNKVEPNRAELSLLSVLENLYPSQWKYVGDGGLIIGGKCPDFANVNGKKALIELFGEYWHRNDDPQDRVNHYKKYGFETLVIWERELKNPSVLTHHISSWLEYLGSISTVAEVE